MEHKMMGLLDLDLNEEALFVLSQVARHHLWMGEPLRDEGRPSPDGHPAYEVESRPWFNCRERGVIFRMTKYLDVGGSGLYVVVSRERHSDAIAVDVAELGGHEVDVSEWNALDEWYTKAWDAREEFGDPTSAADYVMAKLEEFAWKLLGRKEDQ